MVNCENDPSPSLFFFLLQKSQDLSGPIQVRVSFLPEEGETIVRPSRPAEREDTSLFLLFFSFFLDRQYPSRAANPIRHGVLDTLAHVGTDFFPFFRRREALLPFSPPLCDTNWRGYFPSRGVRLPSPQRFERGLSRSFLLGGQVSITFLFLSLHP